MERELKDILPRIVDKYAKNQSLTVNEIEVFGNLLKDSSSETVNEFVELMNKAPKNRLDVKTLEELTKLDYEYKGKTPVKLRSDDVVPSVRSRITPYIEIRRLVSEFAKEMEDSSTYGDDVKLLDTKIDILCGVTSSNIYDKYKKEYNIARLVKLGYKTLIDEFNKVVKANYTQESIVEFKEKMDKEKKNNVFTNLYPKDSLTRAYDVLTDSVKNTRNTLFGY